MNDTDFIQDMMIAPAREIRRKYYTTSQARAYHTFGCLYIQNARELIEMTAEEARMLGKHPCANCIK